MLAAHLYVSLLSRAMCHWSGQCPKSLINLAVLHFFKTDSWASAGGCCRIGPTQCGLRAILGLERKMEGLTITPWLILCTGLA